MIARLRRKLVAILMCVVTLILLAVFVSILLSAAGNSRRMSEETLSQALMAQNLPQAMRPPQIEDGRFPSQYNRVPVMTARISPDGAVVFVENGFSFIMDEELREIVAQAVNSGGSSGSLSSYGLRWLKSEDGSVIAFVDVAAEQEMLKNLVINALPIGIAALAVFFIISLFLARWAVRPVELAWERQRQFVADASHELKTPLTVILSNAEMLSGGGALPEGKNALRVDHIRAEALRMKKLVTDLLTLARSDSGEAGGLRILERVDLSDIVTGVLLTLEPVIYDEGKSLSYEVQSGLFVSGEAHGLARLVQILLDNALKYSSPDGKIEVYLLGTEHKTVTLTVKNEGDAIPEAECERIFRRFYRLDESRSAPGSFGLGLSIAEEIVKAHGGRIWAEGRAGEGNSFFVSLPVK